MGDTGSRRHGTYRSLAATGLSRAPQGQIPTPMSLFRTRPPRVTCEEPDVRRASRRVTVPTAQLCAHRPPARVCTATPASPQPTCPDRLRRARHGSGCSVDMTPRRTLTSTPRGAPSRPVQTAATGPRSVLLAPGHRQLPQARVSSPPSRLRHLAAFQAHLVGLRLTDAALCTLHAEGETLQQEGGRSLHGDTKRGRAQVPHFSPLPLYTTGSDPGLAPALGDGWAQGRSSILPSWGTAGRI